MDHGGSIYIDLSWGRWGPMTESMSSMTHSVTFSHHRSSQSHEFPTSMALWARITKSTDWSTGPLAHPFAHSLAPLTRSLAPHYSLFSRAPLRSLTSLTTSLVGKWMIGWLSNLFFFLFWPIMHDPIASGWESRDHTFHEGWSGCEAQNETDYRKWSLS